MDRAENVQGHQDRWRAVQGSSCSFYFIYREVLPRLHSALSCWRPHRRTRKCETWVLKPHPTCIALLSYFVNTAASAYLAPLSPRAQHSRYRIYVRERCALGHVHRAEATKRRRERHISIPSPCLRRATRTRLVEIVGIGDVGDVGGGESHSTLKLIRLDDGACRNG